MGIMKIAHLPDFNYNGKQSALNDPDVKKV